MNFLIKKGRKFYQVRTVLDLVRSIAENSMNTDELSI